MKENEHAVSPIVATLVLIVVAVVGAVAVGTIMGTFSSDVSKQANTGEVSSQAATEILVAGSTTVQPASEAWAKAFEKKNPSLKISVQGGGSGVGISSVAMNIIDIGASSRALKDTEKTSYPDLKEHQVGGSGVVFIVDSASAATVVTKAELQAIYNTTPSYIAGITAAAQRAEASGTEETAAEYLGVAAKNFDAFTAISGYTGNPGVLKAVQTTPGTIGFVDYGFAEGATGIKMLQITDGVSTYTASSKNIKASLKDHFTGVAQGANYPQGLVRGLYYITNGEPNSIVKSFITFAQSPTGAEELKDHGMFGVAEIFA